MRTTRITRTIAAGAAALIALSVGPAALAAPSESDIAAVREQAEATSRRIADVEVDLARNSAREEQANLRVQEAAEVYNASQQDLAEAEAEALAAQEAYSASVDELEAARTVIAGIAMSAYRSGAGVNQLSLFLEADGITEALNSANTYSVLGDAAEQAQQNFAAATIATDLARDYAEATVVAKQEAAAVVDAAYAASKLEAEAAQAEAATARSERDSLIVELAGYRETTVAMERARQDQIDADRRERDNRAARAAAEEAARQEAANPPAPQDSQPRPSATPPPVSPSPTTPAPATPPPATPSATPSPTPSATTPPSTTPPSTTPAPTARPTASPTPTARPTPTPTPTQAPAPKPKPTPTPTPPPAPKPPQGSGAGAVALAWAKTQLGKPYVWGTAGPNSYDCSGLTSAAFRQAGVSLPRNSAAQYNVGSKVALANLKAGDLIFYSNNGSGSGIYHVGIYAGGGMRLHAPSPGKSVELVSMYYVNILPYGVRL